MKRNLYIFILAWIVIVGLSFAWNYVNAKNEQKEIAVQIAKSAFNQIVLTRAWNAGHIGVYVPVTGDMQPNPYLKDPMRDIVVSENLKLTKVNPAFMTRQVSEIATDRENLQFHITSLKPIRPANKATSREQTALNGFEQGSQEYIELVDDPSGSHIFYMAPLMTEKACLKCHEEQGYREGEIRGGISVTLPFIPHIPLVPLALGHIGISLIGILGIALFGVTLNKAYETIRMQSVIDALTGIPNRRSFSERILNEFNRCQRDHNPLSVFMCDVDHFKSYNDTYGHQMGDDCLVKVAHAITETIKRPGDFCARYGGEEFLIVLADTDRKGALQVAESVRLAVVDLWIPHEKSLPLKAVTLSLGVATSGQASSKSYEELVRHADTALYTAKENGRNRVEVYEEGSEKI